MPKKPREIWETGSPLREAWYDFSNPTLRAEYNALSKPRHDDVEPAPNVRVGIAMALNVLAKTQRAFGRLREIPQEMQADLVEWLSEEDLFAYGFQVEPSADRSPRRISGDFWHDAEIDWKGNAAADRVQSFHRIRIADPDDFPAQELNPKMGRPSYAMEIRKAVVGLMDSGYQFENHVNKENITKIRTYISENTNINLDGGGLGDDAIRKNLKRILNDLNSI